MVLSCFKFDVKVGFDQLDSVQDSGNTFAPAVALTPMEDWIASASRAYFDYRKGKRKGRRQSGMGVWCLSSYVNSTIEINERRASRARDRPIPLPIVRLHCYRLPFQRACTCCPQFASARDGGKSNLKVIEIVLRKREPTFSPPEFWVVDS